MNVGAFHSKQCSTMFRSAKIWSIHPLPFLNPTCSSRNFSSCDTAMRLRITRQNTLLGIESKVIPRQLSQTVRSTFFGTLTIRLLLRMSPSPFQCQRSWARYTGWSLFYSVFPGNAQWWYVRPLDKSINDRAANGESMIAMPLSRLLPGLTPACRSLLHSLSCSYPSPSSGSRLSPEFRHYIHPNPEPRPDPDHNPYPYP